MIVVSTQNVDQFFTRELGQNSVLIIPFCPREIITFLTARTTAVKIPACLMARKMGLFNEAPAINFPIFRARISRPHLLVFSVSCRKESNLFSTIRYTEIASPLPRSWESFLKWSLRIVALRNCRRLLRVSVSRHFVIDSRGSGNKGIPVLTKSSNFVYH